MGSESVSRAHKTKHDPPEVSVVVTCYNYAHYLEGCMQSILAQTYQNFEIILIDDGSTDETPDIAGKFQTVPNFFYVRQQNSGQAGSKNRGIELARGTYVAFLDADDVWHQEKLEKQIALFDQPGVGVVYTRARLMDPEGNSREVGPVGPYLQPRAGHVAEWLLFDNFVWFSSSVVRKQCLQELGGFDESLPMGIDWDLWLRLSMHWDFAYVNEPLLLYRVGHPGQMSRNSETRRACADLILNRFLHDKTSLLNPTAVRKARAYALCNRGFFNLKSARWRSLRFFLLSLILNPFSRYPYKGFYYWVFRC